MSSCTLFLKAVTLDSLSKQSLLIHGLCCTACAPQLPYMDVNAAVFFFQVILIT